MRPRALPFRSLALLGVGWVQFVLVGPGVHDPDCVHHRPGATGAAHVHEAAPEAAHHHHTPDDTARPDGTPVQAQDTGPPSDEECRCLGLCVPGALVGISVPQSHAASALPPTPAVASFVTADADAVLPPLPPLLPPSTGPPQAA